MKRPVALVTHLAMRGLATDDLPIIEALGALGITAVVASWDDPTVNWSGFQLVVLRSCWNYHLQWAGFLRWLSFLESLEVSVLNSVPQLKWNLSKTYLLDLAKRGVPIPPTVSVDRHGSEKLREILERHRWNDVVVKPTISASAYATARVSPATAESHEQGFCALRRNGGVLVQKFVPEVIERGELSFVFLGGNYSHTVLKTVAPGDFRVQTDFGGARHSASPSDKLIAQAREILELAAPDAAYARLDAIQVRERLILMELELIDPVLFFAFRAHSAADFARSIQAALQ